MNQLYQRLKNLLSAKYAGALIVTVCIVAKSLLIFFYSYIGRDKMYHLSASYNLLHGKGWTNSFYYADQPATEMPEPFCLWPPGYGLLVTPVEFLTDDNLRLSTDIVEIIFFISFLLLCRAILRSQGMNNRWLNVSTLLLGFYSYEFIEVSLGTDLPGVCFMLGFFYCAIRLWRVNGRRAGIWLGAIGGLCLFMAAFTRYMYVPVAAVATISLVAIAYWKNNKQALAGYWSCLLVCLAVLTVATLYQAAACGSPFYIGTDKKSLFISNLEYWHPAALAAFLNINVSATLLERISSISFSSWQKLFGWINLVVYAVLLVGVIRFLPGLKRSVTKDFPVFETAGFLLSAATIGELALLSLTNSPKYSLGGDPWTFIEEGRYQAFAVVFLQLFFLLCISRAKDWRLLKNVRSYVMAALLFLFCLNSLHQVYFTVKVAFNFTEMKSGLLREQDYDFAEAYLRQTIHDHPDKEVLITSSDAFYPLMGSVLGAKGIKDYPNSHLIGNSVTKPSVLLVVIFASQKEQYRQFLSLPGVQLVKEINGTYIYRQDLN